MLFGISLNINSIAYQTQTINKTVTSCKFQVRQQKKHMANQKGNKKLYIFIWISTHNLQLKLKTKTIFIHLYTIKTFPLLTVLLYNISIQKLSSL